MKIALVHDALLEFGGAERVFVALHKIFPEADLYTAFYSPESLGEHKKNFEGLKIHTSWADKIPFLKRLHSPLRFLYPLIWESFDFSKYDVVISSCNHFCKGIVTRPETTHISYLHHPPRYLYYYETAVEWQKHLLIKIYGHYINHFLRIWDYIAAQRVNYYVANSKETAKRIEKFYRRDSDVIYPPVSIPATYTPTTPKKSETYYITTSRLARAKHVDILIKAANKHTFKLKIIGTGRDESYLRSIAAENVEFLGSVSDHDFVRLYENAKAFLFASKDEEFGIAPIEAMGYGLPVIAYASGGLKESVNPGKNGYLYQDLDEDSVYEKIQTLENLSLQQYKEMKEQAYGSAKQYSFENFKKQIEEFVKEKI